MIEDPRDVEHAQYPNFLEQQFVKLHPSITVDRVVEAVERAYESCDNPGFCVSCGAESDCCEPDARNYECEECGAHKVFGAEELLIYLG